MKPVYADFSRDVREPGLRTLLTSLEREAENRLNNSVHGDLPRWRQALCDLPEVDEMADLDRATPILGGRVKQVEVLMPLLMELHPWRKGPLSLGGIEIDTEWRSDWKWDRLSPHISLENHAVLDVGCGNGYFGWRMLGAGARRVVGIDPTLVFVMQWLACRHFSGPLPNHVLPLGIEDLPENAACFDSVLSMGVLYHRRDPVQHLRHLRTLCNKRGQVIVETLVLEGGGQRILQPDGRYARMRNVHAIPTTDTLLGWMLEAGFDQVEILDVTPTSTAEQRSTPWMHFESLDRSLDPQNPALTIEGHPAPVRAMMVARA